jgi:hypothetical protein
MQSFLRRKKKGRRGKRRNSPQRRGCHDSLCHQRFQQFNARRRRRRRRTGRGRPSSLRRRRRTRPSLSLRCCRRRSCACFLHDNLCKI